MKYENIKITAVAVHTNGKINTRFFATEKAASNFANAQWRKDHGVTVFLYKAFTENLICTYHK